jgi:hypothetical protein
LLPPRISSKEEIREGSFVVCEEDVVPLPSGLPAVVLRLEDASCGLSKKLAGVPGITVPESAADGSGVGAKMKRMRLGGAAVAGIVCLLCIIHRNWFGSTKDAPYKGCTGKMFLSSHLVDRRPRRTQGSS